MRRERVVPAYKARRLRADGARMLDAMFAPLYEQRALLINGERWKVYLSGPAPTSPAGAAAGGLQQDVQR